ncbi:Rpn family recombination-promoting nuclease/putative transposase [bacterium]|nr:Rpn family recombination-promoting nuclease/putative transposase [bacterium]
MTKKIDSTESVIDCIKSLLNSSPKDDHDAIFKQLLTVFFKEFIDLFLPWFSDKLDFENLEFLDKEIFLYGLSKNKKNYVDLVCKAPMKQGDQEAKLILIHVEIQSTKDNKMAKRMFNYCCQLRLKEDLDIIPIVLFADDVKWKTDVKNYYDMDYNNKKYLHFEYEQIKLLNLNAKDYLNNPNPLAQALMAKMDLSKVDQKKIKVQIAKNRVKNGLK